MKLTHTLICAAAVASFSLPVLAAPKPGAPHADAAAPVTRKITIELPAGYAASKVTLTKGQPVALTFVLKKESGCGDTVVVPEAKWRAALKVGGSATLIYTPQKTGSLKFACPMNMFRGSLQVK
jgi:plastocyanin domain-containing protein